MAGSDNMMMLVVVGAVLIGGFFMLQQSGGLQGILGGLGGGDEKEAEPAAAPAAEPAEGAEGQDPNDPMGGMGQDPNAQAGEALWVIPECQVMAAPFAPYPGPYPPYGISRSNAWSTVRRTQSVYMPNQIPRFM